MLWTWVQALVNQYSQSATFTVRLADYSKICGKKELNQDLQMDSVEINLGTNRLRHRLAEIIYQRSQRTFKGVHAMFDSIGDFGYVMPSSDRKEEFERMRDQYDDFYDEMRGEWTSELRYWPDEANEIAPEII